MRRLEGKVAFITGVARGQGRSHAVRLAEEGADVIGIDICGDIRGIPYPGATESDLDATVKAVEAVGGKINASRADVREIKSLQNALEDGLSRFGRLDIVCANAGIGTVGVLAHEMSEETWRDMIDINLTGVWLTVKAAVPHIIAGGKGGSIVLTSSSAGIKGVPNIAHYVAAKHGVVGLMKSLALELAEHSIRVNSIHPTQVDTDMLINEAIFKLFRPDIPHPTIEQFAETSQMLNALPIPWVNPIDISNAIVFLSSDEGRYITGVALPVDAGSVLK